MSTKQSSNPRKHPPPERESEPVASIATGDISYVGRDVNIAGKIIQYIETRQRDLTYGETVEKDLQVEINELRRGIDDYFERLKEQVNAAATSAPYKELEAYTLSEARIFFGRDEAIRKLYAAMKLRRLTVLQAESGVGKTSLLQAGILPCAIAEQHLAILVRPQFENPSDAIKKTFVGNLELVPKLARAPLVDFLRRVYSLIGHPTTLYLILDQFEEFFSKKTLEADRQEFIADLAACLNDTTLNVHWVISITTDVFGQLGKFEPYIRDPFSKAESLYLFTRKQAAEVIQCSAEQYGLSFEQELLDCILKDLCQQQEGSVAPTQIQLVCTALYNDLRDEGASFTCEHYARMGGAQGILQNYIGTVLNRELPPEERKVAHKVFEALVTSEKKRLIRTKSDLELDLRNKGVPAETLEATLNHLVAGRLLRRYGDDPHCIQYEIVHDYLLKEIELNDELRRSKEAEELLEQGVRNWERRKLLLAPDALKFLEEEAAGVPISCAAATLLFLSAIECDRPARRWLELIPLQEQKNLADSLIAKENNRRNREALWLLRTHLTAAKGTKVAAARWSLRLWAGLRKALIVFLIAAVAFAAAVFVIVRTKDVILWREVTGFGRQCLGGRNPAGLLVAVDAANASHVVVYDSQSRTLCESYNTGANWSLAGAALPGDLVINSLAVYSDIYLATDRGLYYRSEDSPWQTPDRQPDYGKVRSIALSSDHTRIYGSTEQGLLYQYDLSSGAWQVVPTPEITGQITDITVNYEYFAVSTTDGIWYREVSSDGPWTNFTVQLDEGETIAAIELAAHVRSGKPSFIESLDDDWFLAITSSGTLYSGYLSEGLFIKDSRQLPVSNVQRPITSLAINNYSMFIAQADRLYCQQTWTILSREWWLDSRFSRERPCN